MTSRQLMASRRLWVVGHWFSVISFSNRRGGTYDLRFAEGTILLQGDVTRQRALILLRIEGLLTLRDHDRCDAIADQVHDRARFRHESVDSEQERDRLDGNGLHLSLI